MFRLVAARGRRDADMSLPWQTPSPVPRRGSQISHTPEQRSLRPQAAGGLPKCSLAGPASGSRGWANRHRICRRYRCQAACFSHDRRKAISIVFDSRANRIADAREPDADGAQQDGHLDRCHAAAVIQHGGQKRKGRPSPIDHFPQPGNYFAQRHCLTSWAREPRPTLHRPWPKWWSSWRS